MLQAPWTIDVLDFGEGTSAIGDGEHDRIDRTAEAAGNGESRLSYLGEGALGENAAERVSTMTTRKIWTIQVERKRPALQPGYHL